MERRVINPAGVFDSLRYGFSQAVLTRGGRRVHLSGQVGVDAHERTVGADLETQARVALENVAAILREVGGTLRDVVFLRIYLVQSVGNNQGVISRALLENFPSGPPAISWILVCALSGPDWLIEIEAEAVVPE